MTSKSQLRGIKHGGGGGGVRVVAIWNQSPSKPRTRGFIMTSRLEKNNVQILLFHLTIDKHSGRASRQKQFYVINNSTTHCLLCFLVTILCSFAKSFR